MAASDPPELRTLKACTPQLETALKGLESGLVHFLNQEGFITDHVVDEVLNPLSMLTEADKACELLKLARIESSRILLVTMCCWGGSSRVAICMSQL